MIEARSFLQCSPRLHDLVSGMASSFGIVEDLLFCGFPSSTDGGILPSIGVLFHRVSARRSGDIFEPDFGGIIVNFRVAEGSVEGLGGSVIRRLDSVPSAS
jgi:hypothetical protein